MAEENITLGMIMHHMHGMESRLSRRIDGLENRMDRMERNISNQINAIDERLDAIEIEHLPKRVRQLEERFNIAA